MVRVTLLGGPHDGRKVEISAEPPVIVIQGIEYERVDDPDTGLPLGGYVATNRRSEP